MVRIPLFTLLNKSQSWLLTSRCNNNAGGPLSSCRSDIDNEEIWTKAVRWTAWRDGIKLWFVLIADQLSSVLAYVTRLTSHWKISCSAPQYSGDIFQKEKQPQPEEVTCYWILSSSRGRLHQDGHLMSNLWIHPLWRPLCQISEQFKGTYLSCPCKPLCNPALPFMLFFLTIPFHICF